MGQAACGFVRREGSVDGGMTVCGEPDANGSDASWFVSLICLFLACVGVIPFGAERGGQP